MTMMAPSPVVVVVVKEIKTEERQPYIGVATVIAAIGIATVAVVATIMIVIVITRPAMTMPSLVTAVPSIALAAMPPVHLLHKIIAHCRHRRLSTSQPG